MVPSQGASSSQFLPHAVQGSGGFPVLGSAPPGRPPPHSANNYGASLQGGVLPTPTVAQVQYLSQIHPAMIPFSSQVHQPPLQQGPANSPRMIHGVHSVQVLANTTAQHHPVPGAGSGAGGATAQLQLASSQSRYYEVSNRYPTCDLLFLFYPRVCVDKELSLSERTCLLLQTGRCYGSRRAQARNGAEAAGGAR
jgi:hypothetical protein